MAEKLWHEPHDKRVDMSQMDVSGQCCAHMTHERQSATPVNTDSIQVWIAA